MEEYFRAKRELLVEDEAYGDMMATYPAYWSGLKSRGLVVLMDARVLGRGWSGQIMGRNPQVEEWAAAVAPDVGALQHLLSTLDDQRAVWSQVQVFCWSGSRSQQGEGDANQNPPGGTGTQGESDREVVDSPGQEPGAVRFAVTSDPSSGTPASGGSGAGHCGREWGGGRSVQCPDRRAGGAAESRPGKGRTQRGRKPAGRAPAAPSRGTASSGGRAGRCPPAGGNKV